MKLSKTALRELSAKYRAVLMKCVLMNMMIFAGALMSHTANAYNFNNGILTVDQDTVLEEAIEVNTIAFDNTGSNHFTLDGVNGSKFIYGASENMSITGNGTLKNTHMFLQGNVKGYNNSLSIDGFAKFTNSGENPDISDINFNLLDKSKLELNGITMQGGTLTGSASSTIYNGIFDNVDVSNFLGTVWDAQFKNSDTFSLGNKDAGSSMKYGEKVYIYAKEITGYYHGWGNPNLTNEFNSGCNLYLKNYDDTATGTWLLNNESVSLKGGKIEGNLKDGSLRIFNENSQFIGELKNIKIYIENANYTWNDNIKIASTSSGNQFYIGDFSGSEQRVFNMNADIALDKTSVMFTSHATVNGNGNTITTPKVTVGDNAYFNNVTIKSGDDLTITGTELNLTDSTLSAKKSITAGNINVNGTLTVDMINASTFSADSITGADGAMIRFQTASNVSLSSTGTLKISNILLDFANTDAYVGSAVFTNTRMKTKLADDNSIRFGDASFNGDNTITANSIQAVSLTVSADSRLTLKNIDGTSNGVLNGDLNLYGHFTGDMQGDMKFGTDHDWSFNGKFNGNIEAVFKDSVLDTTSLKLAQDSTIGSLTLKRAYDSKSADVALNSDLAVSNLIFNNLREAAAGSDSENAGKITGTGTLKAERIAIEHVGAGHTSENQSVSFDEINIAALNDNLAFEGSSYTDRYSFKDNTISAANHIGITSNLAEFNGNSSLTAQTIFIQNATINGTLTVNGKLSTRSITNGGTLTVNGRVTSGEITGGTLNIILPGTAGASPIISANAENVTLMLDLKNVKSKNAQQYFVVGSDNYGGYTVSGDYSKWAFSDGEFTLDEWKINKDLFKLTDELWNKSQGTLWILKVAGGEESAIDDLRMAGIYVSPTEESASKILEMIGNNPFADRLTDMLDSGDAALQKQALREIVPTDAAASAFKSAKNAANAVMNAVSGRLGGSSAVSGRSGGDLVVGQSSAWAQGMFNHAKMTGGFKSDTAGFSAGVETNLTDEIKAGFGYAYASTGIKTSRSKTDVDTNTGFVYGEYAPNALYVNAMLGFGRSDYDDKTKMSGMSNSFKADTYSARVAAGYDLGMLTPEAALRFTAVRQKAYTDDLGARVAAKNLNTATMVVGAKAAKTFTVGKYAVEPEAKAALTYDIARPNEDRAVTLPDGTSYIAAGEKLNRLGFEIGAKAAVRLTNEVELSVSYDGAFKERYIDHTGLINLKVGF